MTELAHGARWLILIGRRRRFCDAGGMRIRREAGCRPRWRAVAALWLAVWLSASGQGFQARNWQMAHGLSDNTVTALAQTTDGCLWVGTMKGLVRFDGSRFTRAEEAGGGEPPDFPVIGLLTDPRGNLWIASESGRITEFAGDQFRVRYRPLGTPPNQPPPPARLPVVETWRNPDAVFALDRAGGIWAMVRSGNVLRFQDTGDAAVVSFTALPPGRVRGLIGDDAGRVWLLKGTNLCVFEEGRWSDSGAAGIGAAGSLLCAAGERGVWVSETGADPARARLIQYQADDGWKVSELPIPTTPAHPPVSAMLQDHHGRMWLGKVWGGLYRQSGEADWERVRATGPLSKATVRCLFEDRRGSFWAGTAGQGLIQVLPEAISMVLLPPEAADVHVTTVCAGRDGALWLGTDKGLYRGGQRGSAPPSFVPELGGEGVHSVIEDRRTNLWVGMRGGIFLREGSGFRRVLRLPEAQGGILALYEDADGNTWAGGFRGILLRRSGRDPEAQFQRQASDPGLSICGFCEDERGRLWLASKRRGVGLWGLEDGRITPAAPLWGDLNLVARAVVRDTDSAIWIGTQGSGLWRWNNNRLQQLTTADGLPDDTIVGLALDDQDNLWMTSPSGIIGCSRRQLAEYTRGQSAPLLCLRLGLEEGMANRECTGSGQPVITRAPDGRFWVATMAGAAGFSPEVLSRMPPGTQARVQEVSADGVSLRAENQVFRVPAGVRRFEFRYAASEFLYPNALRFRYRLDGVDSGWVEAGAARAAAYGPLRPGEYQFRLMAGGAEGVWREAKLPVTLRVIPRFWETGWFQTLVIGALVSLVIGGVAWEGRRRARQRLRRLETQQAVEEARARIARDLHDDLGSAITEIVQLGDLATEQTLRSRLETMTGLVRRLSVKVDEIVWTMSSHNDTLPNLAGYISSHAQEFFSHSNIKCRLDVGKNLPALEVSSQTRHNVFLAVKEALNNVTKHSGAREARVRVHYEREILRVIIEDDGCGFAPVAVTRGAGLRNMRERLRAVNGQAEVISHPAGGTQVVFTLRLRPAR